MFLFWFFVLVCCAVKCDYVSNNYYIIELPEADIAKDYNTPFKVYWNVPTKQCVSKQVIFDNLEKFGIIQNQNDTFEGGRITIMYDPGVFPAIFETDSGAYRYRNGGVPQQGNLEMHLTAFRESVNKSIPDPNFRGAGVIDFESWRPIFRQQFGTLTPYIDLSLAIEQRRHWWWPTSWQKSEATKRFEDAARVFMQTTLSIAKQMRPRAIWGYYAYPYCFNMATNNMVENCSDTIRDENDKIYWLWSESTALYPSVYSSANLSTSQLASLVRGRVIEANRVKKTGTLVLPYFWFRYRDASYMSETDVTAVLEALKQTSASGLIIWGSSSDVNDVDKCNELYSYVETILGPIVKKYIQEINNGETKLADDDDDYIDTLVSTTEASTTVQTTLTLANENIETTTYSSLNVGINLNFELLPQQNYSSPTSEYNDSSENVNITDEDAVTLNEGSFWDLLKNQLNFLSENKQTTRSVQDIDNAENLEESNVNLEKETLNDEVSDNTSTTESALSEDLTLKTVSDLIPLEVSLNNSVIAPVSTYEDTSVVQIFTEQSTDSLENFVIIKDDQEDDSENAVNNVT